MKRLLIAIATVLGRIMCSATDSRGRRSLCRQTVAEKRIKQLPDGPVLAD